MPQEEHKTVFINYRRKTSAYVARAIFEHLRSEGYDVFMDVESIDSGTFDTIILNQIKARAHFLAILSPGCLEECSNPDDWVRREIEYAIDQDRNIVPIMTAGFKFEDYRDYLTGKLAELSRYNALPLFHEYFDEGMARLRSRYLKQPTTGSILPTPIEEEPAVQRKVEKAADQPTPTKDDLTAEEYLSSGFTKQQAGDLDGAIVNYNEAIRLNPQFATAYYNRGIIRAVQDDLWRAVSDFNEAIRLNPQFAEAYGNRGYVRAKEGNLAGAIADYDEVIRLNPQDARAYNNRGNAHRRLGNLDGAIADYDEAIRLDLQFAATYNNLGEACFAQQQYKLALDNFEKSVELKPDFIMSIAGRAITLHALGRVDEAREQWRELIVQDTRFRDAEWVGEELNWHPALIEEACKLIESL